MLSLKSNLFFLFYSLLLTVSVEAQYHFKQYRVAQGLPHDVTYQVYEDNNGYIWIGTDDGLVRFNGKEFKTYTTDNGLQSNYVIDIIENKENNYLIATWGGGLHTMKNDSITAIISDLKLNKIDIVKDHVIVRTASNSILRYTQKENNVHNSELLYFQHKDKSYFIDSLRLVNKTKPFEQKKIGDDLYFFNYRFAKKGILGVHKYPLEKPIFPFLKENKINDIEKVADSTFISVSDSLMLYHNYDKILSKKKLPLKNVEITKYVTGRKEYDLIVYKPKDKSYENIAFFNKKTQNYFFNENLNKQINVLISDVICDKHGNFWISTNGNGIFQVSNEKKLFQNHYLAKENVLDITENKTSLFFLSLNNCHEFKKGKRLNSIYFDEFAHNFQRLNKDSIFVNFLGQLHGSAYKEKSIPFGEYTFTFSTHLIEKDNLVGEKITFSPRQNKKEGNRKYISFGQINISGAIKSEIINDEIWIIDDNRLLHVISRDLKKHIRTLNIKHGLSSNNVRDFKASKSGVWIATSNGLNLYSKGTIRKFTRQDGLITNQLNSLYVDQHGVLWIAHQKGFSFYKNNMFYNYTNEAGLKSSYINKIKECKAGYVWLLGNNGAQSINNNSEIKPVAKPKILIERKGEANFNVDQIDFTNSSIITQYRLNNNEWIDTSSDIVSFEKYNYGNYYVQFRNRRLNSDWNYSKTYYFEINMPWYKEWWFMTLVSLTISFILFLRIKTVAHKNKLLKESIYKKDLLEKELLEVRENLAVDFHDELGNKLAGITVLTDLLLDNQENINSHPKLKRIKKEVDGLYYGVKDFIWTIDSKNDSLQELLVYLKDFGEELYSNTLIQFYIEKDIENEHLTLPYYWSRQLVFLFKEAMTNALKHARATEVKLSIFQKGKTLEIRLTDNGVGVDLENVKRKNGLLNMRKRAEKIKGVLLIEKNKGTQIRFEGQLY